MKTKSIPKEIIESVNMVYSDGGCQHKNPSPFGGTWSFVYVKTSVGVAVNEAAIHCDSGVVLPNDIGLPTVSNNITELVGLLLALEPLPDGWNGKVFTDSLITLRRFDSDTAKMAGVPDFLAERVRKVVRRMKYSLTLLAGHPDEYDLVRGWKLNDRGNKYPVSKWNAMCDQLCNEAKSHWTRETL